MTTPKICEASVNFRTQLKRSVDKTAAYYACLTAGRVFCTKTTHNGELELV